MSRARVFRLRRLPKRAQRRRSLYTGSRGVWKERRLGIVAS